MSNCSQTVNYKRFGPIEFKKTAWRINALTIASKHKDGFLLSVASVISTNGEKTNVASHFWFVLLSPFETNQHQTGKASKKKGWQFDERKYNYLVNRLYGSYGITYNLKCINAISLSYQENKILDCYVNKIMTTRLDRL